MPIITPGADPQYAADVASGQFQQKADALRAQKQKDMAAMGQTLPTPPPIPAGAAPGFAGGAAPPAGLAPATLGPAPAGPRPANPMPGMASPGMRNPPDAWGRAMAPKAATPFGAGARAGMAASAAGVSKARPFG